MRISLVPKKISLVFGKFPHPSSSRLNNREFERLNSSLKNLHSGEVVTIKHIFLCRLDVFVLID